MTTISSEISSLINLIARLPGLGPRSAQRIVLALINKRLDLMVPLAKSITDVAAAIKVCRQCGNIDTTDPCYICQNPKRNNETLVVVESVSDLWAMERTNIINGYYHVIGGVISPLDGIEPEDLNIESLSERINKGNIKEIIIALGATVEGQATTYYLSEMIKDKNIKISRLAHGIPVGGELDYLDDGTLMQAWQARTTL